METLRLEPDLQKPQTLSPCSSGRRRRRSNASHSPEFEFWMVRNPSLPPPNLLSADELFVDGVLLPLRLIHPNSDDPPDPEPPSTNSNPPNDSEPGSGPDQLTSALPDSSATVLTASKRWKDIFKKIDRKSSSGNSNEEREREKEKEKEKEKKRERKTGVGNGSSSAELNINIWPFSRSRSAGNGGARPKMVAGSAAATRKVSSAPCSRSNSAGESKSRKWPSSPSRGGVHLGRSSPVWQVRRAGSGVRSSEPLIRNVEKGLKKEGNEARRNKPTCASAASTGGGGGGPPKARVLSLNVPMCIGYRHHLGCRSYENGAVGVAAPAATSGGQSIGGGGSGDGGRGGNLFNLRSLFTKKVY